MAKKRKLEPKSQPHPSPPQEDDDEEEEVEEEEEEEVEEKEVEEEEEEEEEEEDDDDDEAEEKEVLEERPSSSSSLSKEAIRELLEPMGKEQLVELVKEAVAQSPSLLARIASAANSDPAHRKIFVHGLPWDATSDLLTAAFSPFGAIDECKAVLDRVTGRCKGYGFVLFRSRAAAQRALRQPQKRIGGRITSCQLAAAGPPGLHGAQGSATADPAAGRKIFVGNVGEHITVERLRAFFSQFGEIEEGPPGKQLRGYAVFTYKTAEGCRKALEKPKKLFEGCELHCKPKSQGSGGDAKAPPASVLQMNDLALAYSSKPMLGGVNPMVAGMMGHTLNPELMAHGLNPMALGFLGQNPGAGLLNPGLATAVMSPTMNRSGTGSTADPYGVGIGIGGFGGGGAGINSMSPNMIGSYGSQATLQGMGAAYQSNNVSSSSSAGRSQSGLGSKGAAGLPPYFGL